jgi:hypothetical protein
MATFRSYPRHLGRPEGRGLVTCVRSGFLRKPRDIVEIDGRRIARDKADWYGDVFGWDHPQDRNQAETGGDPGPVPGGGQPRARSKQELGISDREIEASIRENRPPRSGY